MNRKTADCLLLFIFGIFIGMLIYNSPVISHWDIAPLFLGSKMTIGEIFSNFYYYPGDAFLFRPLAFLLFGGLYNLVGLNGIVYHLIKSVALGAFVVLSYLIFTSLAESERKKALVSSVVVALSPSVLNSIWKIPEIEVIGAVFLYFSFLILINQKKHREIDRHSIAPFFLFITSLAISILFKETMRAFAIVFLASYFLFFQRKLSRIQKVMYVVALAASLIASLFYMPQPTAITERTALSAQHVLFSAEISATMLLYCIFIAGSLIMFVSSLLMLKKTRFASMAGFLLFIFLFSIPAISMFNYMGLVLFSSETMGTMFFFSVLLAFGLVVKAFRGDKAIRFHAATALIVLAVLIGYLLVFPNARQFMSERAFIVVVPSLAYIVIDAMLMVWNFLKRSHDAFKFLLGPLFVLALVAMPYYFFSSVFNASQENVAFSNVDFAAKEHLSELNLSDSVIFYTNEIFHFDDIDIGVFKDIDTDGTKILFLNSHKLPGGIGFKDEICMKVQGNSSGKNIFVYSTRYRTPPDGGVLGSVQGDFEWLESYDTFSYLKPLPGSSQYFFWPWDFGLVSSYQKSNSNKDTQLEEFLANNSKLVFKDVRPYAQIPMWIEDMPQRIAANMPLMGNYQYEGKIYYLSESDLNCSGWYPEQKTYGDMTFRWMSQNATLAIYNPSNASEIAALSVKAWSYNKPRTLRIFLNNEKLESHYFSAPESLDGFVVKPFYLAPGENTIILNSEEGCDEPARGQHFGDRRCLSFSFTDLSAIGKEEILEQGFVFGNNWHETMTANGNEFRWMSQNATLFIYNPTQAGEAQLSFLIDSYYKPRTLELYANENLFETYNISNGVSMTAKFNLTQGVNALMFHSREGCDVPAELGEGKYEKCASFAIGNIKSVEYPAEVSYGKEWDSAYLPAYGALKTIPENATMMIYNPNIVAERIRLSFSALGYNKSRTLELVLNGESVEVFNVSSPRLSAQTSEILTKTIALQPKNNTLSFVSKDGCEIPDATETNYTSCVSVFFSDISILRLKNLDFSSRYERNWYNEERTGGNATFRWMSQNATLFIYNPTQAGEAQLSFLIDSYYKPRTLELYANENLFETYNISNGVSMTAKFNISRGENIVMLRSREGCDTPTALNNSFDSRCLSFLVGELNLWRRADFEPAFSDNWHYVEELENYSWRWMSQNATLAIYNPSGAEMDTRLNFTLWSYDKPRTLRTLLDGKIVNESLISGLQSVNLDVKLKNGLNIVKFNSEEGCEIPKNVEKSEDSRCLSFAFMDLKVFPREYLQR